MVRKAAPTIAAVVLAAACATLKPTPPPSAYIEDIPADIATAMTLDQRIAAADAWTSLREGRIDRARKLLTGQPSEGPAYHVGLGYVELVQGDLQEAEKSFRDSLAKYPDMVPAYVGLAQVYEDMGKRDQAFLQYREIIKRMPDHKWAKGRLDSLRDELLTAAMDDARAAVAAGNRAEAKKAYLRALFYDPGNVDAHLRLARIYKAEKDSKNTLFHLKEALTRRPNDKEVLADYAGLLYDGGNFGQSLDAYEKLADMDKDNKVFKARVDELREKLGIFEVPSQYDKINGLDSVTREDLAALIAVKFKTAFRAEPDKTSIIIDVATSWAQNFIIRVASFGVMKVYENHTFQPRRIINRAELAEALSGLLDFLASGGAALPPVIDPKRVKISDINPDSYYYPFILRAVSLQVLELDDRSCFQPERVVSGAEAAAALDVIARLAR